VQSICNTEGQARQPAPSELTPVKQGHGAEHIICWNCRKPYRGNLAVDCQIHKDHHRRALTARAALAGVGPLPLPITRTEWAELEKRAGSWPYRDAEEAQYRMWLEYARSLSPDYDVRRQISWPIWVCIQLGRDIGTSHADQILVPRFDPGIRKSLIARFGGPILYYRSMSDLRRAGRRRARQ
jgi:hypothetical protein